MVPWDMPASPPPLLHHPASRRGVVTTVIECYYVNCPIYTLHAPVRGGRVRRRLNLRKLGGVGFAPYHGWGWIEDLGLAVRVLVLAQLRVAKRPGLPRTAPGSTSRSTPPNAPQPRWRPAPCAAMLKQPRKAKPRHATPRHAIAILRPSVKKCPSTAVLPFEV